MIGTINIEIQAKNPNMPLWPLRAYVNSPSSLRLRNVPKKIGQWEITSVQVNVNYPDKTQKTVQCVLVGGVWVGTVEGSSATGSYTNGYTVIANGTDENGNPVSGYVLGRGDVEILKEDGTPIADDPTHFVTDDELDAAISSKAEISSVEEVAEDVANLANSLSNYYVKTETSSNVELDAKFETKADLSALDVKADLSALPSKTSQLTNDSGFITSAQVEPSALAGYADKSYMALLVPEHGSAGSTNTENYLSLKPSDNDKKTAATVTTSTYASWFLSYYNGTTLDPPIELKWGYCTQVYIITNGRKRIKTINSNAWFAQVGDEHNYVIKAVEGANYYVPVDSMIIDNTEHPVTYTQINKIEIATIDGQSGMITCARASIDALHPTYELAYRDEVSSKADLSALNEVADSLSDYYTKAETSSNAEISTALELKQDTLSSEQISNIARVPYIDPANTIVTFNDNYVGVYDIAGELTQETVRGWYIEHDSNIKDVRIGTGVTSIGHDAFYASNVARVTIPNSVTSIGDGVFGDCSNLSTVNLGGGLKTIEHDAFYACENISSITIPVSVISIGAYTFEDCERLTSVVFEGKTLTEVQSMSNYPWEISDTSIIKTWNDASQEWVLEQLSALEARIAALENN